jgi:hypothetical protein
MVLTTNHIILGLTWKLGLNSHEADSATAQQYWRFIETWLAQKDHLNQLVSVMSSALANSDLKIIFNPHSQPSKSYTEAFANWNSLIQFVQQNKTHVAETLLKQATDFINNYFEKTPESFDKAQQHTIFSQLRKKLYLWNEQLASEVQQQKRQYFETWLTEHPDQVNRLVYEISKLLIEDELKVLLSNQVAGKKQRQAKHFWESLIQYLGTRENSPILSQIIREAAIFIEKQTDFRKIVPPMETLTTVTTVIPVQDYNANVSQETSVAKNKLSHSLWRWQPLPEGRDNYVESACQSVTLPDGFKLLAARVRGKKHKHEGTHCDDWFEIAHSGTWGIIAVADGAGSKLFSRVGARAACEAAVHHLVEQLQSHQILPRDHWTTDTFARDEAYHFKEHDIELTQQFLHEAMQVAYQAVVQAWHARDELKYYYKALGNRDLELSDLSTTLLLAVHTVVTVQAVEYSLVLTCQIGDGLTVTIYKNKAETSLLSEIERNSFSGETQFLTTATKRLERDSLATKTYPFFSPLRALMVMTDGVADDYFPPEKEMLRLLGDLILNGVIPATAASSSLTDQDLVKLPDKNGYMTMEERIMAKESCPTPICSVANYAQLLNSSPAELITTPAWLAVGIPTDIFNNGNSPEERLQTWLDTYNVRGSFDDRTLVVLYRETA